MGYGKLTKVKWLGSHLPPTTDQVEKLSVACKDLRKALVYNGTQVDSYKTDYLWNGLKSANNGVKTHTDNNKQIADNRQ